MISILLLLVLALAFVYINGFHDTANSIATVVATRALAPRRAIILATATNFAGALVGTAVATTVAFGLVDAQFITVNTVIAALIGAIIWDLLTWWWGLPTSSSHALVGGLCGAALASAQNSWGEIIWFGPSGAHWWQGSGIVYKVFVPMLASPVLGFAAAFLVSGFFYVVLRNWPVTRVDRVFGRLQIFSGGYIGFAHGNNDAQKTVGVVVLGLVAATNAGIFDSAPSWMGFLRHTRDVSGDFHPGLWLKLACAVALAAGTAAGGWRIIRTVGHRITDLKPIHGFSAESTAATVLTIAAAWGFPVSTTHTITAAVGGVGAARSFAAIRLPVVTRIIIAWLCTFPCAALIAYLAQVVFRAMGAR